MKFQLQYLIIILVCVIVNYVQVTVTTLYHRDIPEDATLSFIQIANKYGFRAIEHDVLTEDGYVLKLFQIMPNERILGSLPVLMMHGLADCSDNFIIRGNTSIVVTLAREGYEVWAANGRGNKYGRRHLRLDPSNHTFWNYSLHEHGTYDVAAHIDYVLDATGREQLDVVAHSQGTADFFVLTSTRPEYNDRIHIMLALAPVAFLHNLGPTLTALVESTPLFNDFSVAVRLEEILSSTFKTVFQFVCSQKRFSYEICVDGLFFPLGGEDTEELEKEFLPVIVGHYPQPTSRKSLMHLAQISLNKRFAQYDYGVQDNWKVYNRPDPPDYNLSKVTMKVALFYGANDALSPVKNVAMLRNRLPNVVESRLIGNTKWNHQDFVWAKRANKYLYPFILQLFNKYRDLDVR